MRGRVVGFGDDGQTVLVEHEEIPDFMAAMVMPFTVAEAEREKLEGLSTGNAVSFTLHVGPRQSWITNLQRLPDDALPAHPAARADQSLPRPSAPVRLQPGSPAPPFELVDQEGLPVRLEDYRGKALLVTFIYTRCPLPDFCPLLSRHFKALQPRLKERFGEQVHLLSISFDAAYDTPEVLKTYAARYTDDLSTWRFATGDQETVDAVARAYGVYFAPEEGATTFAHNLTTTLIGPEGRVYQLWRGNRWQPEEVLEAVEQMMAQVARTPR